MAMFLSLDKFQTFCELKSGGASYHPDEGVCNFSSLILVMSSSSDALLDQKNRLPQIHLQSPIILVFARYEL
jgi:hypothetical protein